MTAAHCRWRMLVSAWWLSLAAFTIVLPLRPAAAQIGSDRYSSIIIDAATGAVLSAVNADETRYPASLTKMMTLYMLFEALRDRRLALSQPLPVSAHAAMMPPSKLGLRPGVMITVEEAILGLVTKSANDAAAALGEAMGGDEERFAQMMTLRARALGMSHTTFRNASGLPDPDQVTTARDLALLGRRLIADFPTQYRYFSAPSFVFHGRTILNHDRMLITYPGADGIKTGYIEASGHNLVTSAVRGEVRLIGVVLGAGNNNERDAHMARLLDSGFERMDVPIAPRREPDSSVGLLAAAQASTLPGPGPLASLRPRPLTAPPARWAIQVGSFRTEAAARQAAQAARGQLDAGEARITAQTAHGKTAWRALVVGLSQSAAQSGCAGAARRHAACLVIRPEPGQIASR